MVDHNVVLNIKTGTVSRLMVSLLNLETWDNKRIKQTVFISLFYELN